MKHAIVTGATGFLGNYLVRELLENNIRVTAVIRDPAKADVLPHDGRLDHVVCDMEFYDSLPGMIADRDCDVFFHLAWDSVYGPGRKDIMLQALNVEGSRKAVNAAQRIGCRRFVGIGSIMEKESCEVTAADGTHPSEAYYYGEAKHFSHLVTKAAAAGCGIEHVWAILTNPYGKYDTSTRFINNTLKNILGGEELVFTEGRQMYDFIHAEDAARAIRMLGEKGRPFHSYLVGSGAPRPLREFIRMIGQTLAPERELLFGKVPYTGTTMSQEDFSTGPLYEDTGFSPRVRFEEGIVDTMEWLKSEKGS